MCAHPWSPWKRRLVLWTLATLAGGQSAMARTLSDDEVLQLSLEELVSVDVYATDRYVRQLSREASSGSVVTAEDIRAFGYRSLTDILRSLPGLYVSYDRNYSYLGSRGFGSVGDWNSRILFLVDGQRVNENIYDGAYIGHDFIVDVGLIDRVEYVAGPAAAMLYGNNAFFGVVNVITRNGVQMSGAEVSVGAGSAGTQHARLNYGQRYDSGLDVVVSVSRYQSDGRDVALPELGGVAQGLDYESANRVFAKFAYGDFSLEVAGNQRLKGVPNASYEQVFGDPRSQTLDRQGFVSLSYNHPLGTDSAVSARLYHGRYDYHAHYVFDLAPAPPADLVLYRDTVKGRWWGGEFKYVSTATAGHKLLLGADWQRNAAREQTAGYVGEPLDLEDRRSDHFWGVYVHDELTLSETVKLGLGARYDRTAQGDEQLLPRVSLIHQWRPDTEFKLLYGEAFRPPNAFELYYGDGSTYVPNPALQPERIKTLEGVLEHRWDASERSVLTLFRNDIRDLIDYVPLPGVDEAQGTSDDLFQLRNVRNVRTHGLELRHEHALDNGGQLAGSYTWQHTRDLSGVAVQNSPRQLVKLNWRQPLFSTGAQAGGSVQCLGARLSTGGVRVAGACVTHLTVSGQWAPGWLWSLGVSNLFDRQVADPAAHFHAPLSQIRQDGRHWFLQVQARY